METSGSTQSNTRHSIKFLADYMALFAHFHCRSVVSDAKITLFELLLILEEILLRLFEIFAIK